MTYRWTPNLSTPPYDQLPRSLLASQTREKLSCPLDIASAKVPDVLITSPAKAAAAKPAHTAAAMLSAFTARPIIELKQRDKSKIETILAYGKSPLSLVVVWQQGACSYTVL